MAKIDVKCARGVFPSFFQVRNQLLNNILCVEFNSQKCYSSIGNNK